MGFRVEAGDVHADEDYKVRHVKEYPGGGNSVCKGTEDEGTWPPQLGECKQGDGAAEVGRAKRKGPCIPRWGAGFNQIKKSVKYIQLSAQNMDG